MICQIYLDMKTLWVWVIVILIVGVVGYSYRTQIKSMFSGGYTSPVSQSSYAPTNMAPSTAPKGAILSWVSGYAVAANGMTLYVFDKDTKGVSNCNGGCAGVWPPYLSTTTPASMPTGVTLIKRTDGTMQFAYKGMPVYYYAGDKNVGDTNGDGVGGTWHLVKP